LGANHLNIVFNLVKLFTLIFIVILIFTSCKKDASKYPDAPNSFQQTLMIAHKAGGGSNNPNKENTLAAAAYGFDHLDGIEIDIQKSRDGTIWLYHDETIETHNDFIKRIPGLTDADIRKIITDKHTDLNTLEELLEWKQKANNTECISLDIKPWLPTRFSNTQGYLIELADEVCRLAQKYNCNHQLMAECENAVCLKRFKEKDPSIACYLTTYGNYNQGVYRALKANFDGLSFKFENNNISQSQIDELHNKGLKIQLWTINNLEDINTVKLLRPDFIQTDNVLLK